MTSGVGFALILIYLAIGIITTISVDALAIAMIDEDVYGISDHPPSNSDWEKLLWKTVSVGMAPLVLAAYAGTSLFIWMQGNRKPGNDSIIPHSEYRQIVIEASIDADVCESKQVSSSFHLH